MAFLSSPSTLVRWLSYCLHPPKVTKSMPDETFLVSLFVLSITEITWYHVGVIVSEDAKLYPRRFYSQNLPTNRWHIWVVTKLLRPHSRAIDNQVIAAGNIEARVYSLSQDYYSPILQVGPWRNLLIDKDSTLLLKFIRRPWHKVLNQEWKNPQYFDNHIFDKYTSGLMVIDLK